MKLVLLHGFAGLPAVFDEFARRLPSDAEVMAPCVSCHGPMPCDIESFEQEIQRLVSLIRGSPFVGAELVGYSLGGRLALGLALAAPSLFRRVTLLSATSGLSDASAREARRLVDGKWSQLLRERGIDAFADAWAAQPLFASERTSTETARRQLAAIRRAHIPENLARAMEVLGLGAMPDYGPRLQSLRVRIRFVAGALDEKFVTEARRMHTSCRGSSVHVIEDAGHNLPLEAPDRVASLFNVESKTLSTYGDL